MTKPIRSMRSNIGRGFIGPGVAFLGLHLWDRDVSGVVIGVGFIGVGIYLLVTGRTRERETSSPPE